MDDDLDQIIMLLEQEADEEWNDPDYQQYIAICHAKKGKRSF